jgi:hypothetical protein
MMFVFTCGGWPGWARYEGSPEHGVMRGALSMALNCLRPHSRVGE